MHQKQGMWKDNFAPENAQSAVSFYGRDRRMWPQNWARERNRPKISNSAVSFGGQAADHDRRIQPENRGENGGFIRRFRNRRSNRRIRPERLNASGLDRRFRFGGQAADLNRRFTKNGETKEKPRAFSMCGLRAKPSTLSCKRGRFRTYSGNELQDT